MKKPFLFLAAGCLFFFACGGGKKVEFSHEISDIKLKIEPPVVPGPNTFQSEINFNLDDVFTKNKADRSKIKTTSIETLNFKMEGGRNFDNFESFIVNFYSDKNDMTKLASLAPVSKNVTELNLEVTEKAKLMDYFSEPTIYLIVDANMTSSDSIGYDITGRMNVKFSASETK